MKNLGEKRAWAYSETAQNFLTTYFVQRLYFVISDERHVCVCEVGLGLYFSYIIF